MKIFPIFGYVPLLSSLAACQIVPTDSSFYFDQPLPGDTPEVFAPGIISKEDRFEQFLLYSPNRRKLNYGVTNADWSDFSLYEITWKDGQWTEPTPAPFLGGDPTALTSCFSFEMNRAFFTTSRPSYPPADIWMSEQSANGWKAPQKVGLPVSSSADEFEVHMARSGTLYFSSSRDGGKGDLDIYRAPLVDGGYPVAENLGAPINSSSGDDLPFVAPDESYLVFASDRPGGLGMRDLYISFQIDGAWTEPQNLGARINTKLWDIYPSVSPDGQYLFFTRREAWQATEDSDIYWVSADFIDQLRSSARVEAE